MVSIFTLINAQSDESVKVKIYALNFMSLYYRDCSIKDVKREGFYVQTANTNYIKEANFDNLLKHLEKDNNINLNMFEDYRAILTVYKRGGKKETYFILGTGHIVYKNKCYKANYPLIAAIYSFLPDIFFTSFYEKYPDGFQ
jgi:hypothetical protein